jgi:CRP-like cAMP-binding protein
MPVVFKGLHPDALHRTISYFQIFELGANEVIINAGERHPALLMILRGQLEAFRGAEKRRAESGEVLGLTTLFGSGRWPATLRTRTECRLMVLELPEYQRLRSEGSRVALAIEEYALETLLDGVMRTSSELTKHLDARPLDDLIPS